MIDREDQLGWLHSGHRATNELDISFSTDDCYVEIRGYINGLPFSYSANSGSRADFPEEHKKRLETIMEMLYAKIKETDDSLTDGCFNAKVRSGVIISLEKVYV